VERVSVKHDDGTIDSFQRAQVGSELDSTQLERLYWDEIRWRVEAWFHDLTGRHFLARVSRETR